VENVARKGEIRSLEKLSKRPEENVHLGEISSSRKIVIKGALNML
jgi:hypothetical protein